MIMTVQCCIKEEGEFKHQKAHKNFRTPGEDRTHDLPSSGSEALPLSYWNFNSEPLYHVICLLLS